MAPETPVTKNITNQETTCNSNPIMGNTQTNATKTPKPVVSASSRDLDALRAGHLLRNQTRIEVFDITPDERRQQQQQQRQQQQQEEKPSFLRQVSNKYNELSKSKTPPTGPVPSMPCSSMGCDRLTRRADGLCAQHAEEARAYQEYTSDFSSQESLYEANVVGYDELTTPPSSSQRSFSVEASAYISYRVNLLQWHFVKNELYEWKLKKRYSEFDKLRKDLIASHGKIPSSIQFPSKITVGLSKEKKCLQRCKMLTSVLKGLIAWNIQSNIDRISGYKRWPCG